MKVPVRGSDRARSKAKRNNERTILSAEQDRKSLLLDAARSEFSARGLAGARIDTIAGRSGVNKQLVYYYFGSKDGLYLAVLEDAYGRFARRFANCNLQTGSAEQRLARFVELFFDNLRFDREFLSLVADQNLYVARHVKRSRVVKNTLSALIAEIEEILDLGRIEKCIKLDTDAVDLYLTIAAVCSFYFTNTATLSAGLGRSFDTEPVIAKRRKYVVDFVLAAIFHAGQTRASDRNQREQSILSS